MELIETPTKGKNFMVGVPGDPNIPLIQQIVDDIFGYENLSFFCLLKDSPNVSVGLITFKSDRCLYNMRAICDGLFSYVTIGINYDVYNTQLLKQTLIVESLYGSKPVGDIDYAMKGPLVTTDNVIVGYKESMNGNKHRYSPEIQHMIEKIPRLQSPIDANMKHNVSSCLSSMTSSISKISIDKTGSQVFKLSLCPMCLKDSDVCCSLFLNVKGNPKSIIESDIFNYSTMKICGFPYHRQSEPIISLASLISIIVNQNLNNIGQKLFGIVYPGLYKIMKYLYYGDKGSMDCTNLLEIIIGESIHQNDEMEAAFKKIIDHEFYDLSLAVNAMFGNENHVFSCIRGGLKSLDDDYSICNEDYGPFNTSLNSLFLFIYNAASPHKVKICSEIKDKIIFNGKTYELQGCIYNDKYGNYYGKCLSSCENTVYQFNSCKNDAIWKHTKYTTFPWKDADTAVFVCLDYLKKPVSDFVDIQICNEQSNCGTCVASDRNEIISLYNNKISTKSEYDFECNKSDSIVSTYTQLSKHPFENINMTNYYDKAGTGTDYDTGYDTDDSFFGNIF